MQNEFGLYILNLRKKNHLTQSELANLLCVSHQAVSNWERGETLPDISLILPLSKILETTAERLLFLMCGEFRNELIDEFIKKRKEAMSND